MTAPITVLMSIYNGQRWLPQSIHSVLKQTFHEFELLLINDGSSDNTSQIISDFARADKRIRVINKPNSGLADSLNQGLNQAHGEWIARLDADDLCEPTRLENQYNLAKSRKDLVLIGSGMSIIDESGQRIGCYQFPHEHKPLLSRLIKLRAFFPHSSAFYRKKTVKQLGGYRIFVKRAEDYDLWLRLSEVGELACTDEVLVSIRQHPEQISHDECGRRQLIDGRVALVSYFLRRMGLPDPVDTLIAENDINFFRHFVEARIEQDALFEYRQFIKQIKLLSSDLNKKSLAKLLALSSNCPEYVLRLLKEIMCGESLARRIAFDWKKRSSLCAE